MAPGHHEWPNAPSITADGVIQPQGSSWVGLPRSEYTPELRIAAAREVRAISRLLRCRSRREELNCRAAFRRPIGASGDGSDQSDMVAFLGLANAAKVLSGVNNADPQIRADRLVPTGAHLKA